MTRAANLIIVGTKSQIPVTRPLGGNFDLAPLIYAAAEIAVDRGPATVGWQRRMRRQQDAIYKLREQAQSVAEILEKRLEETNAVEERIGSLNEDIERKVDEALASYVGLIDTTLKNLVSDAEKAKGAFDGAIEALNTRLQEAMDNAKVEAEKRIRAVDEAYRDRIDIKAVADLWQNKRKRHGWLAIGFGGAFAAGLAIVIGTVGYWGADILEAIGLMGGNAPAVAPTGGPAKSPPLGWNTGGLVLAAAAGLSVYALLRQLGRLYLTNLAQHGDADERIAMIDTFLSLEKEGKLAAAEDRILILHALFRPGPGAGAGDEGMPPHWLDLVMQRLDPGRRSTNGSG